MKCFILSFFAALISLVISAVVWAVLIQGDMSDDNSLLSWHTKDEYMKQRAILVDRNLQRRFDYSESLSPLEESLNNILLKMKADEVNKTFGDFPPAHMFYRSRAAIEASPLLPIMKALPKGAILHGHFESMYDAHLFVTASYDPNCYMNLNNGAYMFFATPPGAPWESVQVLRNNATSPEDYDRRMYQNFTMTDTNDDDEGPKLWVFFQQTFVRLMGIVWYKPVTTLYMQTLFKYLAVNESCSYIELRANYGGMYDFSKKYTTEETILFFKDQLKQFQQNNPTLEFNAKLIMAYSRFANDNATLSSALLAADMRKKYPDFIAGFDLVGEEDTGRTTLSYLDDWVSIKNQVGDSLPYYFHDGESIYLTDDNVLDAVLLGTRRIGHGFNVFRFPYLMDVIKSRNVCLEICPISNQLLGLVKDIRLHPAVDYLNNDLLVTISPDDPGVLDYPGVSYDYYMAFNAWPVDLRGLKVLARNAISCSAMSAVEQTQAINNWQAAWASFVHKTLNQLSARDTAGN